MSGVDGLAVVFDLDNTLVHSRIHFLRMRERVIDVVLGSGTPVPTHPPLTSLAIAEIIGIAIQHGATTETQDLIWAAVTDEETLGMELASVEDDALPTLRALKEEGVATALLTNNARQAALAALQRFDLLSNLDLVLARDDVPALKPSPAGLLMAEERLAPSRRLAMVGDATIDGLAANRAGVPFIAFRPSEAEMARRGVNTWATIQSLVDLVPLLSRLRLI